TEWDAEHGTPALAGVDTRSLVLHLRDPGAMRAGIAASLAAAVPSPSISGAALAGRVSTVDPYEVGEGPLRVAVVDYGVKRSIVHRLTQAGVRATVFPHDVDAGTLAAFDGVLLSNGPGDPEQLVDEVSTIRELIGSGPIVIGQACEFDYAGCQALKVLRADGYRTIVVNSNPATIMTDPGFADRTYIEPLDLEAVADVLRRERPDALLSTMGGQTALNLAREL